MIANMVGGQDFGSKSWEESQGRFGLLLHPRKVPCNIRAILEPFRLKSPMYARNVRNFTC